jgi:hypothetical protein
LRKGKLTLPDDETAQQELLEEIEFYGLERLLSAIKEDTERSFEGTVLLSREQQKQLCAWLNKKKQKWKLLYRATRDGFRSSDFHRLCDGKGPTFTIIKSREGHLFGGYTAVSWHCNNCYTDDQKAFIFTLSNPHGIPPTRYRKQNSNAVYGSSSYGPTFGSGHDLYICDNSNSSTNSYSNFPASYADTTGKGNVTFTGRYNGWNTAEIEVFCKQ